MLSIVIQAGGKSRRMGRNKALMLFQGRPLIGRIFSRLQTIADEIFLVSNHPEEFSFLQVRVLPDVIPGKGALGGFLSAFHYAKYPFVAVVGCDLPFVNPALITYEKDLLLNNGGANLAVPRSTGGYEPMHGVYRREECLGSVKVALENGEMCVSSWIENMHGLVLSEKDFKPYDPDGISFINLNTPEEFYSAEKLANRLVEQE